MRSFLNLAIGAVIEKDGKRFSISNLLDLESLMAKNEETGVFEVIPIKDIVPVSGLNGVEESEHLELSMIDEIDWTHAEGWHGKLRTLLSNPNRTVDDVKKVADEAGVHIATVYRKLMILETRGRASALVRVKPNGGKGKNRLTPEVETVIKATIKDFHFNKEKKRRTKKETVEEVELKLKNGKLPMPHQMTIRNRIREAERERKRRHLAETALFDATVSAEESLGADYPLAIVQIDHTQLDIMIVDDEYRLNCGKPWITLAIDVFSRMVVGFYISLDPPGNTGTGQCIAHAMLAKETWLADLDITTPWPCWGVINKIHADNAGEFRGHMLRRACKEYGMDLEWRPVKKPRYGAHIERLLGTLLKEIHKLPGSTESNPKARGEYDSEKHAVMTLSELERWFTLLVVGVYHQDLHDTLNTTPLTRYKQGIFGTDKVLGRGYPLRINDADRLRLDLLPAFERTIQGYGTTIDVIEYKSGVMTRWVEAPDPKNPKLLRKFIFKRAPRNISVIYFYEPELKQYFKIPYRNCAHPPMSIWELHKVRRHLRDEGIKDVDEGIIFETLAQMRAIAEGSAHKSKQARRDRQRGKMNSQAPLPNAPEVLPNDTEAGEPKPDHTQQRGEANYFDEIEIGQSRGRS